MNFITEEQAKQQPKKLLDTVFATDTEGRIFELSSSAAKKFEVTAEREAELLHLPILPYNQLAGEETEEVGGRHQAPAVIGQGMIWHERWLVGPYVWWRDRQTYFGAHMHPWRNYLAHDCDDL